MKVQEPSAWRRGTDEAIVGESCCQATPWRAPATSRRHGNLKEQEDRAGELPGMPEQCRKSTHTGPRCICTYCSGLLESEKSYQSRVVGGQVRLGVANTSAGHFGFVRRYLFGNVGGEGRSGPTGRTGLIRTRAARKYQIIGTQHLSLASSY